MSDNLRIWSQVEKTNPAHTKQVNQRGGFTAIGANFQIMRATEVFGPVGEGWGYVTGEPIFHDTLMMVPVTLWYDSDRSKTFGPIYGCEEWKSDKGRVDSDAPKKAMTDGITKALSHLGFNADVFLGRFDDQRYVADVKREFAEAERAAEPAPASVTAMLDGLREAARDGDVAMAAYWKQHWPAVPQDWRAHVLAEKENIKAGMTQAAALRAG